MFSLFTIWSREEGKSCAISQDSTLDEICVPAPNQIRLFGVFRIDSKYMTKTPYIEFIQYKECLPDRAIKDLIELLEEDLSHDDFLQALHSLGDDCYYQELDHPRYDRSRVRFPIPNEADLKSARDYQAAYPAEFAA